MARREGVMRALVTQALQYPVARREDVLAELRGRREQLRQAGCNYWLFEDAGLPGVLIEFLEARDAATLARAREAAGLPRVDVPILSEVEF
ncbi:MAG: hypothetical protein JNL26_10960 [Gemmatimonadetes bacterium]|nr:hypothetical protein [Gemmatimonadota bacterium]